MISRFLTLLFLTYFFVTSAFFFCIAAIICAFTAQSDPLRKKLHAFACWWGHHYVRINPLWKCRIEGLENIPEGASVLAANHQSYWDIMVLYGISVPYKWVSKESIFNIPFIGWNMKINQYVRLAREDRKSIKQMMQDCRDWLNKGTSIMIFPEGTRSVDGELGEFRTGPFKLAIDANVPVIPIVVDGTYQVLPKDAKSLTFRSNITVRILPAVHPSDYENNLRVVRDVVEKQIRTNLDEIRGRGGAQKHQLPAGIGT